MHDDDGLDEQELQAAMGGGWLEFPAPPPVADVVARGRALRYRRRSVIGATGLAVAALSLAVALPGGAGKPTDIKLADVSVKRGANGNVTLSWGSSGFNATAVGQALAQAGVPAVVRAGSFCTASAYPAAATASPTAIAKAKSALQAALAKQRGMTTAVGGATASGQAIAVYTPKVSSVAPGQNVVVIKARALARGSKLSIDEVNGNVAVGVLAPASRLVCVPNNAMFCWYAYQPVGVGATVTTVDGSASTSLPEPASTLPATTVPASTLPATTVPASTLPAPTVPATTVPAGATTTGPSGAPPVNQVVHCPAMPLGASGSGAASATTTVTGGTATTITTGSATTTPLGETVTTLAPGPSTAGGTSTTVVTVTSVAPPATVPTTSTAP